MDVTVNSVAGQEYLASKAQQAEDAVRTTPARIEQARSNNESPERPEIRRVTQMENRLIDTLA